MPIDLNLLRVFDALMHERKVVAAAERLALSAPAVSNALARLRRSTGDALFTRTPGGMQPTPFALSIGPTIAQSLRAIEGSLLPRAAFDAAASTRAFRLAMTDIGEIIFLPTLLRELGRSAPRVTVHTVRHSAVQLRDEMGRDAVDLAIGWLPALGAGFHQRRLFEQRYVCMMSAQHPLARGRLTVARFQQARHALVVAAGTGHEGVERAMQRQGVRRLLALQVPHFVAVPWIAAETDLVVTVPARLADKAAEPFGLVTREPPIALPSFPVNVFWHRRMHQDPGNRWLRDLLVRLFGDPA